MSYGTDLAEVSCGANATYVDRILKADEKPGRSTGASPDQIRAHNQPLRPPRAWPRSTADAASPSPTR